MPIPVPVPLRVPVPLPGLVPPAAYPCGQAGTELIDRACALEVSDMESSWRPSTSRMLRGQCWLQFHLTAS